jgi:hypothetical protein
MPESPIEQRIENTVQHYLYRTGTFHDPAAPLPPLPDIPSLIRQLQAAAMEQARSGFAFTPDGSEWLRSVARLIYGALDDMRLHRADPGTEKALMHAINCMDAFGQIQTMFRK